MSTPTIDNADNSHDLDELTRLSSLMDRLTNRVDNLENENQRLHDENEQLKARTTKLETLHKVFLSHVRDQNVTTASVESKLEAGAVNRLSSSMENEKKRLEDENAQFERRIYNLEEKLKEKSVKLDDVYDKSVRLERLNTERVQEANRMKELLESGSVVGGDEVLAYVTNRLEHLEIETKRFEDELKTRTLIREDTLKEESVKLDDKCFRLEEKCVRLVEEKYSSLERSNIELVLEVDRIKESIASQIVVGPTNTITQVGFTAVLTKPVPLGPQQTIIYDKAITNIGEGYDIRHGHFSAPVRGLYLISATILSGGKGDIRTEIMSENKQLAAMYGKTLDMGSHTVIVFLKQKEQVWVRHFNEPISNTAHSGKDRYYSSFSGVLIAAS